MSQMPTVMPQHRRIPEELVHAVQAALTDFSSAAAAFIWDWADSPFHVLVVLEDELAGRQACTREIRAHFSDPSLEIRYVYLKSWRRQDGVAGYEQIYPRS